MKAKLFRVTQGRFSELVIAKGKQEAMDEVETSCMGLRKAELIGPCEIHADESYKFLGEGLPENFGYNATISGPLYCRLNP